MMMMGCCAVCAIEQQPVASSHPALPFPSGWDPSDLCGLVCVQDLTLFFFFRVVSHGESHANGPASQRVPPALLASLALPPPRSQFGVSCKKSFFNFSCRSICTVSAVDQSIKAIMPESFTADVKNLTFPRKCQRVWSPLTKRITISQLFCPHCFVCRWRHLRFQKRAFPS